jgi:ribosomal protein S14
VSAPGGDGGDGQDGERARRQDWARNLQERMALVADWGERGLCQACGEGTATRMIPAAGQLCAVKLCGSCADGEETVPLEAAPEHQAAHKCQRCGDPRPAGRLRLCRRCGKDVVRRVLAYQVVQVPGLGAGRSTIDVRVGKN